MTGATSTVLPARSGQAVMLDAGQTIEIGNPYGSQVVDTWALRRDDVGEHMSMEHTRATLRRLVPKVGDQLYSNRRAPLLTLVADTSPGVHDTLIASCDEHRYRLLGHDGYHDNCTDNFASALRATGLEPPPVPAPLNLFMNIPWTPDGSLTFDAPRSSPGDYVRLRAETNVVVVLSACPQDMIPVNGEQQTPTEASYRVLPAGGDGQA